MRIKNAPALALALMLIGTSASIARPAVADDAPLSGNWKLVVLPYGEDEFAIFKLIEKDGKTTALGGRCTADAGATARSKPWNGKTAC